MFSSDVIRFCGLNVVLVATCVVGDGFIQACFDRRVPNEVSAVADSLVHGLVGVFSWAAITSGRHVGEAVVCGVIACLIDVDHFIAAGSLKLQDALNLSSRPPFHNTFFMSLPFVAVLLSTLVCKNDWLYNFAWVYQTAILSHHIRDGYRRGIWLGPLQNIPTYPYWLYIVWISALTILFKFTFVRHVKSVQTILSVV